MHDLGRPTATICQFPAEGGLTKLYDDGIQTLLVEGGAQLHQSFLDTGFWDECFVEVGPTSINGKVAAPILKDATLLNTQKCFGRTILHYQNQRLAFRLES